MCWTFIIQYGTRVFMAQGMEEQAAEILSQQYNIVAMIIFCSSRFICTYLLKFFNPGKLLRTLAIAAGVFTLGVIFLQDIHGLYCLVAVSACMSLMFPTIYGIALKGMGEDAKFGAAGLIMAILGGSILPPVQAAIIDLGTIGKSFPAVNASFILPFICFIVVAWYGSQAYKRSKKQKQHYTSIKNKLHNMIKYNYRIGSLILILTCIALISCQPKNCRTTGTRIACTV